MGFNERDIQYKLKRYVCKILFISLANNLVAKHREDDKILNVLMVLKDPIFISNCEANMSGTADQQGVELVLQQIT